MATIRRDLAYGWALLRDRIDLFMLLAAIVVVPSVWCFIELADEVVEGETHGVDRRLLLALRNPADPSDPIGPPWLEDIGRDLTALGGVAVLTLVTVAVAGYLLQVGRRRALAFVLAATLGGLALSTTLKGAFDRPRPDVVPHLAHVQTASFPSGHSMLSAVVYLTLGALLAQFVESRRLRAYFVALALLFTFLVGASRVYLGVHYPTDVLAGWTAGLAWATLCLMLARRLQNAGRLDQPQDAP